MDDAFFFAGGFFFDEAFFGGAFFLELAFWASGFFLEPAFGAAFFLGAAFAAAVAGFFLGGDCGGGSGTLARRGRPLIPGMCFRPRARSVPRNASAEDHATTVSDDCDLKLLGLQIYLQLRRMMNDDKQCSRLQ